jgi:glycosyltransferase involved in cell wall biosynthesis
MTPQLTKTRVASVGSYIVISPVRNEAAYLPLTIESMVNQSLKPICWVIVNDGSTDGTVQVAENAARSHPWIRVVSLPDRGYRKAGGGVVAAFYAGYKCIEAEKWDYLVKLDGDVSFGRDYFERCLLEFTRDPRLGITGGTICSDRGGSLQVESAGDPQFHVRGATKIYSAACWQAIGGLIHAPGWDTLDEVKANMLGWTSRTLRDVKIVHHRETGAAYGAWKDRVKSGLANYIAGYHPLFMFLKCVQRLWHRPYIIGGIGLLYGFVKGYVTGIPQVEDRALIKYFRQQQVNRLLGRKSLWD